MQGKDETPESKLALENINQVIDRMIDAYARAVALAGNDAANRQRRSNGWRAEHLVQVPAQQIRSWSKRVDCRHSVEASSAPEPTPITTLPAAAAATAPTTGTTSASSNADRTGCPETAPKAGCYNNTGHGTEAAIQQPSRPNTAKTKE